MKKSSKSFILMGLMVIGMLVLFHSFSDYTYNTSATQRTVKLKRLLACCDRVLRWEVLTRGGFSIIQNIFTGSISNNIDCAEAVTYTTIADYTFLDKLKTLIRRWHAPISFALHAPGYDFAATMNAIQYSRHCLPESELIRSFVSFHLFFPSEHTPDYVPHTPEEALLWPFDCQVAPPPYSNILKVQQYKREKNLTFPINVARNIARQAANTYFILASDVELFPSHQLSDMFLDMVSLNESYARQGVQRRVFAMPVFELQSNALIPYKKSQLLEMLDSRQAIPFHASYCKMCHLVPDQNEWYLMNDSNSLTVSAVDRRYYNYMMWEPFYISDNREPLFDERVTWEGKSNKRIQAYAMCLLGYEYHVLHPAFLVHSPGIKEFDERLNFVRIMNNLIEGTIQPEYRALYGDNPNCRI